MRAYGMNELTLVDRFGVYLSARAVRRATARYRQPALLDVGCGYEATTLCALAPSLASGVGVDTAISAAAKSVPGLRFIEGTVEDVLPTIADASFDVVTIISVLEHLWDAAGALTQCRRLLAPGGTLVVNVPTWRGKEALELALFRLQIGAAEALDDHKTYYDKRDLWPVLVKAGFKGSEIELRYHKLGLNLFALARRGSAA